MVPWAGMAPQALLYHSWSVFFFAAVEEVRAEIANRDWISSLVKLMLDLKWHSSIDNLPDGMKKMKYSSGIPLLVRSLCKRTIQITKGCDTKLVDRSVMFVIGGNIYGF